jgi:homoserine kinase type II
VSVYTEISDPELRRFLADYTVGEPVSLEGIAEGIENTNYRVRTRDGRYVLTVFEQTAAEDLPFCVGLMAALANHGIPSARPIADRCGGFVQTLQGKPALLVEHLAGKSVTAPSLQHCRAVGDMLAQMHVFTATYPQHRDNERGRAWHTETAAAVRGHLDRGDRALLDRTLAQTLAFDLSALPQGVIHADLFRDNVLFEDHTLSGLIDFYYAHTGALVYDLAVVVADWCFEPDGSFLGERAAAIADAYGQRRSPNAAERSAWPAALRAAGLRFWLSREFDRHFPRAGVITQTKDPGLFQAILVSLETDGAALNVLGHQRG